MIGKRYTGDMADRVMDLFGVISRYLGIYGSEILDDCIDSEWETAVLQLADIIRARQQLDIIEELRRGHHDTD